MRTHGGLQASSAWLIAFVTALSCKSPSHASDGSARSPGGTQGAGSSSVGNGGGASGVSSVAFPLAVSANGRYLEDQKGVPFRIVGDSGWDADVALTLAEWQQYLDGRRAKGFNTILVQLTTPNRYHAGSTAPASKGAKGALPFLRNASGGKWDGDPGHAGSGLGAGATPRYDADFSSPNPAYFDWIDTMLAEAKARGMLVVLTVCYLGYDKSAWWHTLENSANTQAVSYGFGQFLGNRYKSTDNIVWEMGVDMLIPSGSEGGRRAHKILEGIQATGDTHLWTGHWVHDYLSTDEPLFAADIDIQGVYTHGPYPTLAPTYALSREGYNHAPPLPTVLLETTYEGEHNATLAQLRAYMWGAQLSAIGGVIFGNLPMWDFAPGWQAALNSPGSNDMARMSALLDSLAWQELVPSALGGMKTLIPAGTGTFTPAKRGTGQTGGEDWVVSAATANGRYLVAYVPDPHAGPITVDMTALAGTSRARWYDPSNGTFNQIGSYSNAGAREFTVPGSNSGGANDWVLVLERD